MLVRRLHGSGHHRDSEQKGTFLPTQFTIYILKQKTKVDIGRFVATRGKERFDIAEPHERLQIEADAIDIASETNPLFMEHIEQVQQGTVAQSRSRRRSRSSSKATETRSSSIARSASAMMVGSSSSEETATSVGSADLVPMRVLDGVWRPWLTDDFYETDDQIDRPALIHNGANIPFILAILICATAVSSKVIAIAKQSSCFDVFKNVDRYIAILNMYAPAVERMHSHPQKTAGKKRATPSFFHLRNATYNME